MKKRSNRAQKVNEVGWGEMADQVKDKVVVWAVRHEWLIRFLEHGIGDERILRLIGKWLNAGVLEEGVRTGQDGKRGGYPAGGDGYSPNAKHNFQFERVATDWRGTSVPDYRLKR